MTAQYQAPEPTQTDSGQKQSNVFELRDRIDKRNAIEERELERLVIARWTGGDEP